MIGSTVGAIKHNLKTLKRGVAESRFAKFHVTPGCIVLTEGMTEGGRIAYRQASAIER